MDPALQVALAKAIVFVASASLIWRIHRVTSSRAEDIQCSRCPAGAQHSASVKVGIRPAALRVLDSTPSPGRHG
jgi:hypothetical protein